MTTSTLQVLDAARSACGGRRRRGGACGPAAGRAGTSSEPRRPVAAPAGFCVYGLGVRGHLPSGTPGPLAWQSSSSSPRPRLAAGASVPPWAPPRPGLPAPPGCSLSLLLLLLLLSPCKPCSFPSPIASSRPATLHSFPGLCGAVLGGATWTHDGPTSQVQPVLLGRKT